MEIFKRKSQLKSNLTLILICVKMKIFFYYLIHNFEKIIISWFSFIILFMILKKSSYFGFLIFDSQKLIYIKHNQ
jgi:hypothetical protein